MDLGIAGRTALVMGASRGIGRGIAEVLAAEGAQVALSSRSEESLREAQTSGLVRTDFDPAETARALTAMADRYCYLAFVFDPPESGAPSPDDAIDLLTTLWANAIALVEP